jgi:hypothetical protein
MSFTCRALSQAVPVRGIVSFVSLWRACSQHDEARRGILNYAKRTKKS